MCVLSYRGLSVMDPGAGSKRPCLRLANGRVNSGDASSEPPPTVAPVPVLCRHDSIKISIDNTNTCTDSVVTALGDPVNDYITPEINFRKVSTFFLRALHLTPFLFLHLPHLCRVRISAKIKTVVLFRSGIAGGQPSLYRLL